MPPKKSPDKGEDKAASTDGMTAFLEAWQAEQVAEREARKQQHEGELEVRRAELASRDKQQVDFMQLLHNLVPGRTQSLATAQTTDCQGVDQSQAEVHKQRGHSIAEKEQTSSSSESHLVLAPEWMSSNQHGQEQSLTPGGSPSTQGQTVTSEGGTSSGGPPEMQRALHLLDNRPGPPNYQSRGAQNHHLDEMLVPDRDTETSESPYQDYRTEIRRQERGREVPQPRDRTRPLDNSRTRQTMSDPPRTKMATFEAGNKYNTIQ